MISGNGHKVLQGLAGLAAGHGFGCVVLQTKQEISQGGPVRVDQSASALIGFGCSKHRRRSWSRNLSNLHSIFANLSRLAQRNRNAHHSGGSPRTWYQAGTQRRTGIVRRNRQNASLTHSCDSGQKMTSLFAIRYSLFASSVLAS
jgi:hypothetical protein